MKDYRNLFSSIKDRSEDLFSSNWSSKSWGRSWEKPRAELIKPYLHWLDEKRLTKEVKKHMDDDKKIDQMYSKAFNNMRKINRQQLIQDTKEFYEKDFPKELIADIFNLYYKDSSKLDYEERGDKNQFRYKVLDNVIDPIGRMISESSNVKSMIMTRSMVQYFSMLMAYQKQVDPEEFENMKNCMNGQPGGQGDPDDSDQDQDSQDQDDSQDDSSSSQQQKPQAGKGKSNKKPMTPEEVLQQLMKNDRIENLQEEILEDAKQTIDSLSEVINDQEQEAIWQNDGEDVAFDKESINKLLQQFLSVKMSMGKVRDIIKNLLNKSRNYFNGREKPFFENLFEAASIDGLEDYALLHPKLRKLMAEDVMVKDSIREGKINIYIDCSGSMGANMVYNNNVVSGMDFAKSFAMQMLEMDLIEKVYYFDTTIYECAASQIAITGIPYGGGTDIETVVKHVEQQRKNAIVLTDACDSCYTYSPYAYFIGIVGARFNYFADECIKKYSDKAQAVEFDGTNIYEIDRQGRRGKVVK